MILWYYIILYYIIILEIKLNRITELQITIYTLQLQLQFQFQLQLQITNIYNLQFTILAAP